MVALSNWLGISLLTGWYEARGTTSRASPQSRRASRGAIVRAPTEEAANQSPHELETAALASEELRVVGRQPGDVVDARGRLGRPDGFIPEGVTPRAIGMSR